MVERWSRIPHSLAYYRLTRVVKRAASMSNPVTKTKLTMLWVICKRLFKVYIAYRRMLGDNYDEEVDQQSVDQELIQKTYQTIMTRTGSVSLCKTDLDKWDFRGKYLRGHLSSSGPISFHPINHFMLSTLYNLGGSETYSIPQHLNEVRYGGGREDSLLYLKKYNRDYEKVTVLRHSINWYAKELGTSNLGLVPFTVEQVRLSINWNGSANPGPSFVAEGGIRKLDCYDLAFNVANLCVQRISSGALPAPPLYGLAGRAKLLPKLSVLLKYLSKGSAGRAVMMADSHEAIICACFLLPLMERLKRMMKVVLLGFNKFSDDVTNLTDKLNKYNLYLSVDFSSLDSTTQNKLIRVSFGVIRRAFTDESLILWGKVLDWLEEQFIETSLVFPSGEIGTKPGGVPSGSGLTSIIDSIVTAIVMIDALEAILGATHGVDFNVWTYGDDVIVGLVSWLLSDAGRRKWGSTIVKRLADYISDKFSMDLNVSKTRVCPHLFVRYGTPILPTHVSDFSSDALRMHRAGEAFDKGRKLRPEEKMKIIPFEPEEEFTGGTSHRWTYVFSGSLSFLSFYFHDCGRMIRPTFEIITRLLNPEDKVTSIEQHIISLKSALIENQYNRHTVNHIMHYLYDAQWMSSTGVNTRIKAMGDVRIAKRSPPVPSDRSLLPESLNGRNVRAWYRRQREVSDLRNDPRMYEFFAGWDSLLVMIKTAFDPSLSSIVWNYRLKKLVMKRDKGVSKTLFSRMNHSKESIYREINFMCAVHETPSLKEISLSPLLLIENRELESKSLSISLGSKVSIRGRGAPAGVILPRPLCGGMGPIP